MSAEVQRILEAALKLTDDERAQVLTVLADSMGSGEVLRQGRELIEQAKRQQSVG